MFIGRYEFLKESILIRDIELLKKITIKDFEHFVDHSMSGPESFITRSLFFLKDDYIDVDCKDLTTRYTNDVIAFGLLAFGLKVDSHSDENNKFYAMGKKIADFKFSRILLFVLLGLIPYLLKILDFDFIPKSAQNFFRKLVSGTMKEREERNIIRPDMIHLLMAS